MNTTAMSGLLKCTGLGDNMQINRNPRPSYPAPTPPPMPTSLQQLAAAEGHHSDKGYELGTREGYEAAVAQRRQSSGPPPLTYEEMLHELWYLRRRVRQLEQEILNKSMEQ